MTAPVQERTGRPRRTNEGGKPLSRKEEPGLVLSIALTTALGFAWAAEVGVGVGVSIGNLVTGNAGKPLPR